MPGDALIAGPALVETNEIVIAAGRDVVFDFLAQMGLGRAGWYSYDVIDNLGRRSATAIHEEWLVHAAGETVPAGPISFVAEIVDRPEAYVLRLPQQRTLGHTVDFTLAYQLEEIASGTRLTTRTRLNVEGAGGRLLSRGLLFGDGVMIRRQLRGLRQRCEARHEAP